MRRLWLLLLLLPSSAAAQVFDTYGGQLGVGTCTDPGAITYSVSSVARAADVVTIVLTTTASPALWVNAAVSVSGTTPDMGTFNTPVITTVTQPFILTSVTPGTQIQYSQTGNVVGTTASAGTVTLQKWSAQCFLSNRSFLRTPFGEPMWLESVQAGDYPCAFGPCLNKYLNGPALNNNKVLNWAAAAVQRMQAWNLNTVGEYVSVGLKPTSTNADWGGDQHPIRHMAYYDIDSFTKVSLFSQRPSGAAPQPAKGFATGIEQSRVSALGGIFTAKGADMFDPNFLLFTNAAILAATAVGTPIKEKYGDFLQGVMSDDGDDVKFASGGQSFLTIIDGMTNAPPGNGGAHFGFLALISAPNQTVGVSSKSNGAIVSDVLYPDTVFYAKQCLADWLQALNTACNYRATGGTASRSGSVVTMTFGSNHPFIANETVTITGCSDTTFNSIVGTGVVVTTMPNLWPGATNTSLTFTLAGAGVNATGCVMTTGPGYAAIAGLNTAWGSSYSSFGTAGSVVSNETVGTGDGVMLSFTHTLVSLPVPLSIAITVGSTLTGGDDGSGPTAFTPTSTGTFLGSGMNSVSSSVDYSTKVITTVFTSAPGNGVLIKATYNTGGWRVGTGLLDEDGRNVWMPTDGTDNLSPSSAGFKVDMNGFLVQLSKKYHQIVRSALAADAPHLMYFGATGAGGWCVPSPRAVYQGLAPYVDLIGLTQPCGATDDQARYQYTVDSISPYKRGFRTWEGMVANADSALAGIIPGNTVFGSVATQTIRGTQYHDQVVRMQNLTASDGIHYFSGIEHWRIEDQTNEGTNFGLVTAGGADNSYDAREAAVGAVFCSVPLGAYVCGSQSAPGGGAVRPFGDYLTIVTATNLLWTGLLSSGGTGINANFSGKISMGGKWIVQ